MRILQTFAFCILLAGCQSISADVTVFQDFPNTAPQTFTVKSSGSLEEKAYSDMIASQLTNKGWILKSGGAVEVTFAHSIDGGRDVVSSVPIFGQTGGGVAFSQGTVFGGGTSAMYSGTTYSPATFGVVGAAAVTNTVYKRQLQILFVESRTQRHLYEVSVLSQGTSGTFGAVAPCLIAAAFQKFPQGNGTNAKVEISKAECAPAQQ